MVAPARPASNQKKGKGWKNSTPSFLDSPRLQVTVDPTDNLKSDEDLKEAVENFRLSQPEITDIEITTVRGTRLRLSEANQAAPSFVPIKPVNGLFAKPHCSPEQLIAILQQRGLIVEDVVSATSLLKTIGYYRLSGYGLQFRVKNSSGKLADEFIPGTRFQTLTDLYDFDRRLRLLLLDAIERIEVAFRAILNDSLAALHGSHWFMDANRFSDKRDGKTGKLIFDHQEFLSKAYEEASRNKESLSIRHYYLNYGDPPLPSCWMLGEVLSMGTWSKAYGMLAERSDQKPVADAFRSSPPELASWIHALTNLRNTCAHHSRLWDRCFVSRPARKGNLKLIVDDNSRLFAQVATVLYCLHSAEPKSQWLNRLINLLTTYPDIPLAPMGFPENWREKLENVLI
jgi:abortive infection bacteriophage resistance protein